MEYYFLIGSLFCFYAGIMGIIKPEKELNKFKGLWWTYFYWINKYCPQKAIRVMQASSVFIIFVAFLLLYYAFTL